MPIILIFMFCFFQNAELSVFETNIRFVGGFLTMYALTGDALYKEKAQLVADKLLPAFETPTGIPNALVNINTGVSRASCFIALKSFFVCVLKVNRISSNPIFVLTIFRRVKTMAGLAADVAFYPSWAHYI